MIVKKEIIRHARSELPNECCGFLVQKTDEMVVFRCVNSSSLKYKHVKISAKEYVSAATLVITMISQSMIRYKVKLKI